MTCDEMTELMSLALDQPLDGPAHSGLQTHLQDCLSCQRLWSAFQEIDRLFLTTPLAVAPAGFASRAVAATVARRRRDSLILGGIAVLWGLFVMLTLLVISVVDNSGVVIALLGQSTALAQAAEWLALLSQILLHFGEIAWRLVWLLRQLASVPAVALTLLLAMSSGLVVLVVLMRTGQRPAPSLL